MGPCKSQCVDRHVLTTLLGTAVRLFIHATSQARGCSAMHACKCSHRPRPSINQTSEWEKCDLSGFDCGMDVTGRRDGLSVSDSADLLGSKDNQPCERKCLADERAQRKITRLF